MEKQFDTWFAKIELKEGLNINRLVYQVGSRSNNYAIWYNVGEQKSIDGIIRTRVRYFYNKNRLPKKWQQYADYLEKEVIGQSVMMI